MKDFIKETLLFFLPVLLLSAYVAMSYSLTEGDLVKTGYFHKDNTYRKQFEEAYHTPIRHRELSDIDTTKETEFDILVIGDSFSVSSPAGYKNRLAQTDSVKVLGFNYKGLGDNYFDIVDGLLNGDFFDKIKIDYVLVQSVERYFVFYGTTANYGRSANLSQMIKERVAKKPTKPVRFSANAILKYPYYSIIRKIKKDGLVSKVYCFDLDKDVFSGRRASQLLVYDEDIKYFDEKNSVEKVAILNDQLNKIANGLKERGIKLIVLPAPDKYDLYCDHIINNKQEEPLFFPILDELPKDYIYIDSYQILKNAIANGKKDIYFADDTHWSPWATEIIAGEILKNMKYE
ncbi:hypothetical protein LJC53_07080 [Bacteroidales bacterium OttesenSCG-928-C03]|nr:hypothetical protein [Bacteroidales bacterium OttesenSCG-928-C03]MDL2326700.1 hypothetical protein [Bacteroidales bacterium OttesenSCG-928-A14]